MRAGSTPPGFETAATVVHRVSVLLDAGVAPNSAWLHAASGIDSPVASAVAGGIVQRGAVGRELDDLLLAARMLAPPGEREAWAALAAAWAVATESGAPLAPTLRRFAAVLRPLGMPVSTAGEEPGDAARRKLLRSVAWKGVAAVVNEALAAARVAGLEEWMRAELLDLLRSADDETLTRFEDGSRRHARRRAHEMADVAALLRELGVAPHLSDAARAQLEELDADSS